MAIIDLDSPYNPPRRLRSRGLPWLVCDVQWSPFAARDYWVVSTANHRALVWNLNLREDSNSGAIEHSLQGHSRAITDVNFSAHHQDLLATCSVDGYVHWWDLRRPKKPVLTYCDWFAGATQVKFNRQLSHISASAHDRWLHIWDARRTSEPLKSISAHTSKIYGIDWNRIRPTGIVTCSLDKSIRFWDYGRDDDTPEHVIRTDYPVWRARHTPFGWGLLAMPQNEPGDLYLYDRLWPDDSPVEVEQKPVAVFPGHGDHKAKEFLWRSRGGITDDGLDTREFQLVSWGTDNELRLHCVDANILSSVQHVKGGPARKGLSLTRQGATYKTFRTVDDGSARDRKFGTMSDHRASAVAPRSDQSAFTLVMRSTASSNRQSSKPAWRGPSMKAGTGSSRKSLERSQAQLGWMRGITMTRRKASVDGDPRRHVSKPSHPTVHDYLDDEWGQPDTIQEELLRVSTQIPKVKWENIDMDNLTLSASLTGPWGAQGELIFVKVKIDIPADYPKLRAPRFAIEKTSFMPEETREKILREVHELAEKFLSRKQNCLEVAFTYLLGEIDLESSTTLFKNVRDLDDDLDGMADDSSSEDEGIPTGGSASMPHDFASPGDLDTTLAHPQRSIIPPMPRTCGARFSNDSRLVCFFPSEEKVRTLVSTSATESYNKDRAKGEPFFAGFGRLAHDLPPRQRCATDEASATDDQSDAYDSDVSWSSSSGSESTSIHQMSLWYLPNQHLRKTWSENRSVRSSGGGTGVGTATGTGTGTSRRRPTRPKILVSMHDLGSDLPSRKRLAEEYAIFGEGHEVCQQNAQVAEKHGCTDLVNVWRYLALLLRPGVPYKTMDGQKRQLIGINPVLADGGSEERWRDHDKVSTDEEPENGPQLLGRVRWGRHPLGGDFVKMLFDYYERVADVQMLAMLSCIFSETTGDEVDFKMEGSRTGGQQAPLSRKVSSLSPDGLSRETSVLGEFYVRSHTNSAVTTPATFHTPVHYAGSQASEDPTWGGETGTWSLSCGETPPTQGKPSSRWPEQQHSAPAPAPAPQQAPASRSPSNRGILRANSGLASALAANLPRPFSGGSSSSPPSQGKKKPTPAEMILSSLAFSTGGSGHGSSAGAAAEERSAGRTSVSEEEPRKEEVQVPAPICVSIVLEDQKIFDDDGWLKMPFLDSSGPDRYGSYRYAYAEMLQMWGQPLARLEVLKFNVLQALAAANGGKEAAGGGLGDAATKHDVPGGMVGQGVAGGSPPMMASKKKKQMRTLLASGRGLDVTGICRVHETQLEPMHGLPSGAGNVGGAVGTCDRCRRTQTQLRCVFCLGAIDALFSPCLACGCASHEACLAEWHAAGETVCPGGDECNCVEQASNGQVESWAALHGAVLKGRQSSGAMERLLALRGGRGHGGDDDDDDDDDDVDGNGNRAKADGSGRRFYRGGHLQPTWGMPHMAQATTTQQLSPITSSLGRLGRTAGRWPHASSLRRSGRRGDS